MLVVCSTLILLIIVYGLIKRKQPTQHVPAMSLAFALDVGLVLYIELTRHAINTVTDSVATPADNAFLLFHVSVSLITLLLYVILTFTGYKLLRGERAKYFAPHRYFAAAFLLFRLTNYVTSFWMA